MRRYALLILVVFVSIFSCENEADIPSEDLYADLESKESQIQKGKVLFSTQCRLCHALDPSEATGMAPVLDSVDAHWPDKKLLAQFISNAPKMMASTEHTRNLYEIWKDKPQMTSFEGLTRDEIDCIIAYITNK
jgi:mono/diheme cytochrome c family protein